MVIFASWQRHSRVGHYETVGVPILSGGLAADPGGACNRNGTGPMQQYQTLFARGDEMLQRLHAYALDKTDPKTVANEIINSHRVFTAPRSHSGDAIAVAQSDGSTGGGCALTDASQDGRRRSSRVSRPSRRWADDAPGPTVTIVSLSRPRTAGAATTTARSLSTALDDAARPVTVTARPQPADVATQSVRSPLRRTASEPTLQAPLHERTRSVPASAKRTVAAVAPVPASTRYTTIAAQAVADVRAWVRRTANHGPLARRVHFSVVPQWTSRCRTVLLALTAALRTQPMDERAVITQLCVLWMLPGEIFAVPPRGGKKAKRNRLNMIQRRLDDGGLIDRVTQRMLDSLPAPAGDEERAWAIAAATAITDSESDTSDSSDSSQCASDEETDSAVQHAAALTRLRAADKRAVQRAERMFELGDIDRALQAVASTSEPVDLNDSDEREKLRRLHPSSQHTMPPCPRDAPMAVVDVEWMFHEMHGSDTGAAAGPAGYGSNYLSVLAEDRHCVEAMALFVTHMVNNTLPATVRTFLTTCTLVSLSKDNGGRRPIAIGDLFYRLASRFVVSKISKTVQELVAPHQYGAGQPDGCTQVVQSVQHLLTTTAAPGSGEPGTSSPPRPMAC